MRDVKERNLFPEQLPSHVALNAEGGEEEITEFNRFVLLLEGFHPERSLVARHRTRVYDD